MAASTPNLFQRLRAALSPPAPEADEPGEIKGFVDGCVAGEIRGWARDPSRPTGRVHVIALEGDRVVAEALADQPRADLVKAGHGDGRHGFRLRLPAALLDGQPRRLHIEAIVGGQPVKLRKGEVELTPAEPEGGAPSASAAARAAAATAIVEPEPAPLALAVWPGRGSKAALPTDWAAAGARLVKLGQARTKIEELARAHTVVFAGAGDRVDPAAAALLQRSRPLSDVLTWDGEDAASRRPEAKALGLLLGETFGGAFAVRGHVFHLMGGGFADAVSRGDLRRVELLLASRPDLRWSHLPWRLVQGPGSEARTAPAKTPDGLDGFFWLEAAAGQPRRLVPAHTPRLISIGIWPAWGQAAEATLGSLLAQTPTDMDIEVLTPAGGADQARALVEALGRSGVLVRDVDPPALATPGGWLAALTSAAVGEAVIVCQAGVRLDGAPGSVAEITAWAASPSTGAVTVAVRRAAAAPLAGLALGRTEAGWAVRSAFAPDLEGQNRPILAAPASFLAIGRDKLAMLGEAAAERLPAGGVDLDLGLRLRRLGLASVLLGGLSAQGPQEEPLSGEIEGPALAAFDADELAAAAAAYPVSAG